MFSFWSSFWMYSTDVCLIKKSFSRIHFIHVPLLPDLCLHQRSSLTGSRSESTDWHCCNWWLAQPTYQLEPRERCHQLWNSCCSTSLKGSQCRQPLGIKNQPAVYLPLYFKTAPWGADYCWTGQLQCCGRSGAFGRGTRSFSKHLLIITFHE